MARNVEFQVVARPSKGEQLRSAAVEAVLNTQDTEKAIRFKTDARARTVRVTAAAVLRAELPTHRARRHGAVVWVEPRGSKATD